jgi:hypothetical protein
VSARPRVRAVFPLEALIYVNPKSWEAPETVGGCWSRWRGIIAESHRMHGAPIVRRIPMIRYALIGLAAAVLVGASLVPDDALARRGGGGFHGGGMRAGHVRGGAVHAGRYAHVSRPIAGRPVARAAAARGVYRGAAYRGAYRGAAYGAAAVGAAALGAYGYNNRCQYDTYGNWVCPNQYPY